MITITKKQVIWWAAIIIVVAGIVIFSIPTPNAAYRGSAADFPQAMLDTINSQAFEVVKKNLTNIEGDNRFYQYMVESTFDGEPTIIAIVGNAIKVVCGFVIVILAFTRYFQNLDKGKDPVEGLYEIFSEIFITGLFMINIDFILEWVVKLGEWFIEVIAGLVNVDTVPGLTLEAITGQSSGGALWIVQAVLILIIPYICSIAITVIAQWLSFSILIELGIRKAFAPIAVCDIYGEGMRSPGIRYLKKYLATFLKIAVCLLACILGKVLTGLVLIDNIAEFSGMGDLLQYIFRVVIINFTVVGVMMKGGEYANDILGVH